jgi:hypothetical protein
MSFPEIYHSGQDGLLSVVNRIDTSKKIKPQITLKNPLFLINNY